LQLVHDWIVRPAAPSTDGKPVEEKQALVHPVPAPDPSPALYKLDILLDTARGNQTFVASMLKTFINGTYNALRDLGHALEAGNLPALQATAHKLRPSLVHLQIQPAVVIMDKLENWDDNFRYDHLQPLVEAADHLLRQVLADMHTELEAHPKAVID
jgi:hypothetical protein